jgi:hypothetical protein
MRSTTGLLTSTSPGAARADRRAAMFTVEPQMSPSWNTTGPQWIPMWGGSRPLSRAWATISVAAPTAATGSRNTNIPPSPNQRTGRPA